jgi:hypothetical protein
MTPGSAEVTYCPGTAGDNHVRKRPNIPYDAGAVGMLNAGPRADR